MNLTQMRSELISLLGNRSLTIVPAARYNLWLNNAEIEIASAFQFFQCEKFVKRVTISGTSTYQLPSDCLAIYSLRDSTNNRKIRRTHYRKLDNIDYTVAGDPSNYIRFGSSFQLYPIPNSVLTLQMRYARTLTSMVSDTDNPTIPQPWHEGILLGGEYRGWRALGEVKKAVLVKQEFVSWIRSRAAEWEIEDSDEEFGMEVAR